MNKIAHGLAMLATRRDRYDMSNKIGCHVLTLYKVHFPDNHESWHIFEDDDMILFFSKGKVQEPSRVINLDQNRYPKWRFPLEDTFSPSDASKTGTSENKFSKTIDQVKQVNIGTKSESK